MEIYTEWLEMQIVLETIPKLKIVNLKKDYFTLGDQYRIFTDQCQYYTR